MRKRISGAIAGMLALAICVASRADPVQDSQEKVSFHIDAPSMSQALLQFTKQSRLQLAFTTTEAVEMGAPKVVGILTPSAALDQLLKGTGLKYEFVNDRTVSIRKENAVPLKSDRSSATSPENRMRLAQGPDRTEGNTLSATSTVPDTGVAGEQNRPMEEVLVTGSRLNQGAQGAEAVKVITRQQIERSGLNTVSEVLNTLPSVSTAVSANPNQLFAGASTVRLRGLPLGTTLILLNGRRVQSGGITSGGSSFFNLNNIPVAAIERIEVLPEGSSAIYGSDALGGIVNIILKRDIDGIALSGRYGNTSEWDQGETVTSIAAGRDWAKANINFVGSYMSRSELSASERAITANADYRSFGGRDARTDVCNPGNVYSLDATPLPGLATRSAGVPDVSGTATLPDFQSIGGALNACTDQSMSVSPASQRVSFLLTGEYEFSPHAQLLAEILFTRSEDKPYLAAAGLPRGSSGTYRVPASNPYNPFGRTVGVSYRFADHRTGNLADERFTRPLLGLRGKLAGSWSYEAAAWTSKDDTDVLQPNNPNPARVSAALSASDRDSALNVFTAGAQRSAGLIPSLLDEYRSNYVGKLFSANGFVRGDLWHVPGGALQVVLGSEYSRSTLSQDIFDATLGASNAATYRRNSRAFFAEARLPVIGDHGNGGDTLVLSAAGRYDDYSDFGSKTTPHVGAELRPLDGLLIRGTWGKAFRAPSLLNLYIASSSLGGITITDPARGSERYAATIAFGGNPSLRPETAESRSFGFQYTPSAIPGLRLSVTNWRIKESDAIQFLAYPTILGNEALFPGLVVRAPPQGGTPGQVQLIRFGYANFGEIDVAGFDYDVAYQVKTRFGDFSPELSATQTYHYYSALVPGGQPTDRRSIAASDSNWAPHWKGTARLGWSFGPYSVSAAGRYVDSYRDYGSFREIGNFWLVDLNARYDVRRAWPSVLQMFKDALLDIGTVNLLNREPQYSNYNLGSVGYDPTQADIRGRFVYAQLTLGF